MSTITPITKPFCNSGTKVSLPSTVNTYAANQETGFPDAQATPFPTGTAVKQDEMNGALNLYTNLLFQQGQGLQYTFDSTLSAVLGGYPVGAILYCASNNTFQQSLVSGNTADFVINPAYVNDGVNWRTIGASVPIHYISGSTLITGFKIFNGTNWDVSISGATTMNFTTGGGGESFIELSLLNLSASTVNAVGPLNFKIISGQQFDGQMQIAPTVTELALLGNAVPAWGGTVEVLFSICFQSA